MTINGSVGGGIFGMVYRWVSRNFSAHIFGKPGGYQFKPRAQ